MNIYELPSLHLNEEVTAILTENENIRIERIVSTGQVSGWYDQTETEDVILLEGSAVIEYDNGESFDMSKGDTLLIEPHKKHRVSFTSSEPPCIWLCVFFL